MTSSDELFNDVDVNHDGSISKDEFREFIRRNSVMSNSGNFSLNNLTSITESDQYESSTFAEAANYDSVNYSSANTDVSSSATMITSTNTQQYETDAQGLFNDKNPQVIRKPAPGGPLTYEQNIKIRFLQPPPAPPPGPLIIKEIRPPQPPPLPPLVVRQRAPTPPQEPPLILRERPPVTPTTTASQTIVKNLQPIPVPPRSVVVERIPAQPPKPRDIIIERWMPYPVSEKRKTIVQRAEAAKEYSQPRNTIIEYEPQQIRVVRQFQRLNVTQEDPQSYIQRYGDGLLDAQSLLQQARAAGVIEDLSPPAWDSIVTAVRRESIVTPSPTFGLNINSARSRTSGTARMSSFRGNASFGSSYSNLEGFDELNRRFSAADTNQDGALSPQEFRNAGFI